MDRPSQELLQRLNIPAAVSAECATVRNQIPLEPWVNDVSNHQIDVADAVRASLQSGRTASPGVVVNARKASHGTRPVPILAVEDRVIYRALAGVVLRDLPRLDRSAEAYRDFLRGPIDYAHSLIGDGDTSILRLVLGPVKYVVEADISAFYQYVDHELLRHELTVHTGEVEAVDLLIQLLSEIEGRSFGLPQLLDPSDWLSDVYVQVVERDLLRRGLAIWRYNDDFRIACTSYTEALDAIERLGEASRSVGLTLNEHKTRTPTFFNYFFYTTGRDKSDTLATLDPGDVDVIVDDYPDLTDDDRTDAAIATLERLDREDGSPGALNLKAVSRDDVRAIQRAVTGLTALRQPAALSKVVELWRYMPALVPRLSAYMEAIHDPQSGIRADETVDLLIESTAVSEWQALWLVHVIRRLRLLGDSRRVSWVRLQRERGRGTALGAEAALALSESGLGDFDDSDTALRVEPEALAPWHLNALAAIAFLQLSDAGVQRRLAAVGATRPLYKVLVGLA